MRINITPEEETFNKLKEPAPVIDKHGNKFWYNEKGQIHREHDLPAVIGMFGSKFWYKNGQRHRENGPAIMYNDGTQRYWKNGIPIK